MKSAFLSRFTPSLMPPEALEAIFVQREREAQRTVELVRESILTANKSHTLFVGPRGIGKTHLVSLIYHRLRTMSDLNDRLLIAWLREEEWGVSSFLGLLQRILRALAEDNPTLAPRVAAVQEGTTKAAAERAASDLLREIVGSRTLLLLAENLDDLFEGLGEEGQKRFRAFLQDTRFSSILATSQSLFGGVSRQTSPFYNFFRIQHLPGLSLDEAVLLLTKIAQLEEDAPLTAFLQTPAGRARVRAVHHLAGGNPRVYVIFSEFLTREALDELVSPFLKMLDELTPYYQSKMRYLSPQQREIVEILTDARGAIPVKDIAERSYASHQTISSQLKDLREKGYVRSHSVGRESFYELQEPLMRLCLEVKKQRGEPIKLFVDFLRLWCTREDLERRLASLPMGALLTEKHLREALRQSRHGDNPMVAACVKDWEKFFAQKDHGKALQVMEELTAIRGEASDWFYKGFHLDELNRYEEALTAYEQALRLEPANGNTWNNKSIALYNLERYEDALAASEQSLVFASADVSFWNSKGAALGQMGRLVEALTVFEQALAFDAADALSWQNKGIVLAMMGKYQEALLAFDRSLDIDSSFTGAWKGKAMVFNNQRQYTATVHAYDRVLTQIPNDAESWQNRGVALYYLKQYDEALRSYDNAIQLNKNSSFSSLNRVETLMALDRWAEAFTTLKELLPQYQEKKAELSDVIREAFRHLLTSNPGEWVARAETLTALYNQHGLSLLLGQALTDTIPDMNTSLNSPATRQLWLETWQETTAEIAEMRLPLHLLDAAIRYYDLGNPSDPRILLELPVEERSILESLLGVNQE